MNKKTLIRSSILIFSLFLLDMNSKAQQCTLTSIDYVTYNFKGDGLIEKVYDSLLTSDKDYLNILAFKFNQFGKREAFLLSIQDDKILASHLNQDSFFYTNKCVKISLSPDFLPKDSTTNKFFYSQCNDIISSHQRAYLFILNNFRNIRIQYESFDGHMAKVLDVDKSDSYLSKAYNILKRQFGEAGLPVK